MALALVFKSILEDEDLVDRAFVLARDDGARRRQAWIPLVSRGSARKSLGTAAILSSPTGLAAFGNLSREGPRTFGQAPLGVPLPTTSPPHWLRRIGCCGALWT